MVFPKGKAQILLLVFCMFILGGVILRAQVPLEVGRRDWASAMPDGEGKGLVLGTCIQCHSLNPVVLQRKTPRAWEQSVQDMIARGAQIHVQELDPITAYLSKSFGPGAPPLAMSSGPRAVMAASPNPQGALNSSGTLPEGGAKDLILRECTSCHVLSKTTEARKTAEGWRGNVKDMIRLGAKLNAQEETNVVAYLTKHFAREAATTTAVSTVEESPRTSYGMGGMARTSTSPAHLLPDDEGKALILATCVQCHSTLVYVLGMRKDAEGWRRSVEDMIARGAQVTPEESEVIIRYLTKHMAPTKKAE